MKLLFTLIVAGAALLGAGGCRSVAIYEKVRLQDPQMKFEESGAESHFYQKVYYSREGSVGAFGSSAGGGCGCY